MSSTTVSPRVLPWALAFVITRAGDLWSTSLFMLQPGGEAGEMNPLTSMFGLSFWPLVVSNLLLSAAVLYGHWYYCATFGTHHLPGVPADRSEYVSLLFFGRTGRAWRALYTVERNQPLHYGQLAHVLMKAITCTSVLAVVHNLGQVYDWGLNDHLRAILVRPALVYYGVCLALVGFFAHRSLVREFKAWQAANTATPGT
ncbi:MAG: hypothetical protein R2817_14180 [Flavobacteriales bacterium]